MNSKRKTKKSSLANILILPKTLNFKKRYLVLAGILIIPLLVSLINQPSSTALSNPDKVAPRAPIGFSVAETSQGIELRWRENLEWDLFAYQVYVRQSHQAESTEPILTGRTDHFVVTNLEPGLEYFFSLRARDIAGNLSQPTPEVGLTPQNLGPDSQRQIAAWIPATSDLDNARQSLTANLDVINVASPFWYHLEPDGRIIRKGDILDANLINQLRSQGVQIIPTITNNFDANNKGTDLLKDSGKIDLHVDIIVAEVNNQGWDGIDIDYENLNPDVRDQFTAFIAKLADRLHQSGKVLSVTVQPKKSDFELWRGVGANDYPKLGALADQVRLMTYDYSRLNTSPGSVAPLPWLNEVIKYSLDRIPPAKILVGIPFYGYQWCTGSSDSCQSQALTYTQVQSRLNQYHPVIEWDQTAKTPWYAFTDSAGQTNVVHFENSQSFSAKIDLIKSYSLAGIAIWRLGNEDPENFEVIRQKIAPKAMPPQNLTVAPLDQKIKLTWQSSGSLPTQLTIKNDSGYFQQYDVSPYQEFFLNNLENNQTYQISLEQNASFGGDDTITRHIITAPYDSSFPGTIADLAITDRGASTIDLSWTTPGDEYFDGQADHFEIRYANQELTPENFDQAEVYPFAPTPLPAGTQQKWQLRNLTPGEKYFISLKTVDESGNASELSNIVAETTIDNLPPKAPEISQVYPLNQGLRVEWRANDENDLAGYKLYFKQGQSHYQVVKLPPEYTFYELEDLENGSEYFVNLTAFDKNGNESARAGDLAAVPSSQSIFQKIGDSLTRGLNKLKAAGIDFARKVMTASAIPYLVLLSVMIINVFVYYGLKSEIRFSRKPAGSNPPNRDYRPPRRQVQEVKNRRTVLRY